MASQLFALVPIFLLQFTYGMNTGFPAILTPQLAEEGAELTISADEESWIVSLDNLATPLVCVASGCLQQLVGPKTVLLASCFPYVLAWITCAQATGVHQLYLSRVLVGFSHALVTTTVYPVEIASKEMRGTFSLWESVLRCLGCLVTYTLGFFLRWQQIAYVAPVVPLLAFLAGILIPESPVFLVRKGRLPQAERALRKLYGKGYNVKQELDIIQSNIAQLRRAAHRRTGVWQRFISQPEIYKPFFIIIMLSVIQQFSGISILRAYVVKIFNEVFGGGGRRDKSEIGPSVNGTIDKLVTLSTDGGRTAGEAYMAAIIIGMVRLISSLLLAQLLTRYRRRSMYFLSASLTIFSLCSFATCKILMDANEWEDGEDSTFMSVLRWSSMLATCFLVFAAQMGVQTLPFLLSGELFASDVRAVCKGLCRGITCALLIVSLKLYPALQSSAIGLPGTFYLFAACMAASVPAVYCMLPETKDLGLEMIQGYFTPTRTVFYVESHCDVPGGHETRAGHGADVKECTRL